ncbi:MAG TPA: hypothetical protein VKZ53_01800 [Candidatus Angelobacter sp.]|nr:hypothetical protein [Candidatus Angelobacter sp.]
MGVIPLDQALPKIFLRPDDSEEIGAVPLEHQSTVMRVGFDRKPNDPIVFEGETPAVVRFSERTWVYRYSPANSEIRRSRRWRLEIVVTADVKDKKEDEKDDDKKDVKKPRQPHIRERHLAVTTREPYGSKWVEHAIFRRFFKKPDSERNEPVVPELKDNEHPVDWLERRKEQNEKDKIYDPWEKGSRYVAGISVPNGHYEDPRNSSGSLVLGACPDFDSLVTELMRSDDIRRMLRHTEMGTFVFWHRDVEERPTLHPRVIEDSEYLMGLAVQQALAGPSQDTQKWENERVSKLVEFIYAAHLNNSNRMAVREQKHVTASSDETEK